MENLSANFSMPDASPPNSEALDKLAFAIAAMLHGDIQEHVSQEGCYCPMGPRSIHPPFGGCFAWRVNSYQGEQGQGCEIVYTYALDSDVWECRDVYGPEIFRACNWRKRNLDTVP